MNIAIIIIIAILMFLIGGGLLLYLLSGKKENNNLENLIRANRPDFNSKSNPSQAKGARPEVDIKNITEIQRESYSKKKPKLTEEDRYYHAGLFSVKQRENFKKIRIFAPFIGGVILGLFTYIVMGKSFAPFGLVAGVLAGVSLPSFYIDSLIKKRQEEIMYYLPLIIEQIAIGVSSSLDIGPCLQRVIQMADERDSHNVVTELIFHAERYIRTGVGLEEAMNEVANKAGHAELKHAFMALAQVSKHGGEISHQLHELAHAVSSQRETQIDARIKRLELKATGPVALVFIAFMATLMIGIMIKIKDNI